jgi:hypothetical protein
MRTEKSKWQTHEDGTEAVHRGGTTRSSCEVPIRVPNCRSRPPLFSIIPLWLSLFSSEVSMLEDTELFAQASSQEN